MDRNTTADGYIEDTQLNIRLNQQLQILEINIIVQIVHKIQHIQRHLNGIRRLQRNLAHLTM